MRREIHGIPASEGIVSGKAYFLKNPDLSYDKKNIENIADEVARLDQAIEHSCHQVKRISQDLQEDPAEKHNKIMDIQILMLQDPEFTKQIKEVIEAEAVNAEHAVEKVSRQVIQMLEDLEDNPYMQERKSDITDISQRLMANLLEVPLQGMPEISEEVILVADDLKPSDTVQLNTKYIKGFVTKEGGQTSHSSIIARALGLPAVVGAERVYEEVSDGSEIILDAEKGKVIVNPEIWEKVHYKKSIRKYAKGQAAWEKLADVPTQSADGKPFEVAANITRPNEVPEVLAKGAEGIGLYRTEFLYMDAFDFPGEETQFKAYKEVLSQMGDEGVIVRTIDIGGDKDLPYAELPKEDNPFLGYRAIRISLNEPAIFETQIRALLRASVYGNLKIMFPMIATIEEFLQAKAIVFNMKDQLIEEGYDVASDIDLGIMIEIPAVAALADKFAEVVDFFSIGSNDLVQYAMAADRMNKQVSYLYQPYHPGVLRLIKHIIDAAHAAGIPVGMCGEMAAEERAIPLLVGLGLDEFSMSAPQVLKTRFLISKLDSKKMQELAGRAVTECSTQAQVEELVKEYVPTLK